VAWFTGLGTGADAGAGAATSCCLAGAATFANFDLATDIACPDIRNPDMRRTLLRRWEARLELGLDPGWGLDAAADVGLERMNTGWSGTLSYCCMVG